MGAAAAAAQRMPPGDPSCIWATDGGARRGGVAVWRGAWSARGPTDGVGGASGGQGRAARADVPSCLVDFV